MAQLNLDVVINNAQAAKSVGEIRAGLKELKGAMLQVGEGTAEFDKLAMAAAELKDRMDDANDAVRNFNPGALDTVSNVAGKAAAGVSLVTGAMGLFGEQSKETEKALLKVQSAMALAQGVQGLDKAGQAFKQFFNLILANPITAFTIAIVALGTALYKVYSAQQDANSELAKATREYEKQKEATAALSREYDRQIDLLTAQGASTEEIIAVKRKLIEAQIAEAQASLKVNELKLQEVQNNDSLWESLMRVADVVNGTNQADAAIALNKKERSAEAVTQIKEQKQALLDLQNQLKILDVEEQKAAQDKGKRASDQMAKSKEDAATREQMLLAEIEKRRQIEEGYADEVEQREYELWQYQQEQRKQDREDHRRYLEAKRKKEYDEYVAKRKQAQRERQQEQEDRDWKLSMLSSVFQSVQSLMGKNAKAQKAFAVAQTTVDTYMAAQKAYASQLSVPTLDAPIRAQIAAGVAILSGLARVKQILSVDTNGNSSGGGAMSMGDSGGSLSFSSQPNVNTSAQPSTLLNEQGQVMSQTSQQPIYVAVTEINATNSNVMASEERSRF